MIDLLIGGSPCQGFSFSGKQLNFFDPRSKLFFDFVKAKEILKPKYFLLENVKMKKEYEDIITQHMGVEPIEINSALVSAQNRVRLYWTNIPNVQLPEDKNIKLQDVILAKHGVIKLVPFVVNKLSLFKEKYGYIPKMFNPYNLSEIKDKCPCLTAEGNSQTKSSSVIMYNGECYTMLESGDWEIIQTIPIGYTECLLSESKRKTVIGNGWTVDVIAHIFSYIPEIHFQTVVSLFDGISCGQVALERAGKVYNQYYASEIDKHAIQVTQKNYPHTMQLGDITKIDWEVHTKAYAG